MKRLTLVALLSLCVLGCDATKEYVYVPVVEECVCKPCDAHEPRCEDRCEKCKCCEDDKK